MPASYDHELMVRGLMSWINSDKCPLLISQIYTDCTFLEKYEFPPLLGGFRPDIFAISSDEKSFIIADAKTSKDVESMRTREQLIGFANWLSNKEVSYLVLGVPWVAKASAMSLLKSIIKPIPKTNITPIVIDCSSWLLQKN